MKAIIITTENRNMLGVRYEVEPEDYDDVLPIGYILVAEYGDHMPFETVTQEVFDQKFINLNVPLLNGFFSVMRS